MSASLGSLTGDLRVGDLTQVLLRLQGDNVLPGDFAAIATNEAMRAEIVAAIMKYRLFATPEEQVRRLLDINANVWRYPGITEAAIRALGDPPDCPPSDENGLYCVCLFHEVGNAVKTFLNNWAACVHVHGEKGTWKWGGLVLAPEGVAQRPNVMGRTPNLRWQVAELGRKFQKQAVKDVCPQIDQTKTMGMGQELPLIAALHPKWAMAMNGDDIPFVDAPDLVVAPFGRGEFHHAPYLRFYSGGRQVGLFAGHVDDPGSDCGSGSLL